MAGTILAADLQALHRNLDDLAALDESAIMAIDLLIHRALEAAGAPYDEDARQARDAHWRTASAARRAKKGER